MQDVIQISSEAAVVLVVAYFGTVYAFGRLLLGQFERRASERDTAQAAIRKQSEARRDEEFARVRADLQSESRRIGALAEDVNGFMRRAPIDYVRREDYIVMGARLETKVDMVVAELRKLFEKGGPHGH